MKIKYYLLFILFSVVAFGQQNTIETKIDKTQNKIGAQFNLTLKTVVDTNATVVFPFTKSFGSMEVIRNYVVDTVKKDNRYELVKRYGLTQFEPGTYTIPSVQVLINNKPAFSNELKVQISDVVVDTLKQKMFDIKPVIQPENSGNNWWIYLLILFVLVLIGASAYYFYKKRKTSSASDELIFSTPIEKAIGLLKILEKKQLWQKGEIKLYYVELTDIAREYIEEIIEIPAKEFTTSELIVALRKASTVKKLKLTKESIANLEKVLRQADLVKFAKSKPLDFEIQEDQKRIEKSIISLHQSIPTEVEESPTAEWDELQKANQAAKNKKKKVTNIVVFSLFAILLFLGIVVATKGYDYLKDNIIGHPTKELLEGKWIRSEYGVPSVNLETPKVLKRIDFSQTVPKEMIPLLKEGSAFVYGSMQSNFYIGVITATPKAEMEYDLTAGLDNSVKMLGGQNVVYNHDEFSTKNGAVGIKGYGTFTKLDPVLKQSVKIYFEMVLFKENGGYQQVIVLHEEGDEYANQITAKVISSVEFNKAKE